MKLILLAILALLAVRAHADTTEASSGVFEFDVRDSAGTTEAFSSVFSVDARDLGNAASSASSVFALGTQSGNLDALVIDAIHVPSSVVAGQPYTFAVLASFAGQGGSVTDVSTAAKWFIVGEAPAGTRFEGNKLIGGNVTVPTVIRVAAAFNFPSSGMRESLPVEVTIMPGIPGFKVVAVYSTEGPTWVSNAYFRYTLTCNAATDCPQGAAQPSNVFWDLDEDGEFDDATGLQAVRNYVAGRTVRIGVRAEWPLGVGPPATAVSYFFVTFDQPGVSGEPIQGRALDALNGSFMDSGGQEFVPLASKKANGLVILTHGLWQNGTVGWLQEMRDAITSRLSATPPNVAIYDWGKMSDATAYRTNGVTQGENQPDILKLDDVILVRPNGKSQGILIADWIDRQRQSGKVDRAAKIHLIGHSAGGFAIGECARLLLQRLYTQVQVTMLDTPLPYQDHIKPAWRTERYVSSWIGGNPSERWQADAWNAGAKTVNSTVDRFTVTQTGGGLGTLGFLSADLRSSGGIRPILLAQGPKYYRKIVTNRGETLDDRHSASHEYYLATISAYEQSLSAWPDEVLGDGFNQSLLVNGADFAPSPQAMPQPQNNGPQESPPYVPPMDDFSTFGTVQQTGSTYQVTETFNAGIFKNLTLPLGATTLQFQLQVITAGDGDFVSIHWNDGDALAIIPETSLAYDAPLLHEIDLTGLGGQTGTLTLKLISRGAVNSIVEFSEIRILESADVDGDGLTNVEELASGSDVFDLDSDGDSLTDGEEVHSLGTSPVTRDTDGDGQDDASELSAGTNPLVPQSRFAAAMGSVVPGVSAAVHWNGVAGRSYRVVRSQELGTLNMDFLKAGLEGVAGPMTYVDPNPPPIKAFYWIEVE